MYGSTYLTCNMPNIQSLRQIVRHGYKQFVCEMIGHDVSHVKAKYIHEKISKVTCERCGIPLTLSYTSDGSRIKINEISI
jgi:hypothetical protein